MPASSLEGPTISELIAGHERDRYLAALEYLVVTDFNAQHDDVEWDAGTLAERTDFAVGAGLDSTVARKVANLAPVGRPPTPAGCSCGGSGIRCCEHARDR